MLTFFNYNYHVTVTLTPDQNVVIPRTLQAAYICHFINNNGNIQQYHWLVNDTQLEDLNLGDRVQVVESRSTGILSFINIPEEYNDTTIQCETTLTSGEIIYSNNAILSVQGEDKLVALQPYAYIVSIAVVSGTWYNEGLVWYSFAY